MNGKPPSVVLLCNSLTGGGAEKRALALARHLFDGRTSVCVLLDPDEELSLRGEVNLLDWRSEWSYPRIVLRLRSLISKHRPDVVLALGRFPNILAWAATRLLRHRPVLVLSEITQPSTELESMPPGPKRLLVDFLLRRSYPVADLFLANSIDGLRQSIERFRAPETRATTVPNLIDSSEVRVRAAGSLPKQWPTRGPVVVAVGRLVEMKRLDTLLRALTLLPDSVACGAVIVGDGPERPALESLTRRLGISERVDFSGWLQNPFPTIASASAFVICSEYEGFSNSMLEAMTLETPVIASLCSTDIRHLAQDGSILGFETGNAEQLAKGLETVLTRPQVARRMSVAAANKAKRHSLREGVRVYEELIRKASLSRRSGHVEAIEDDPAGGP